VTEKGGDRRIAPRDGGGGGWGGGKAFDRGKKINEGGTSRFSPRTSLGTKTAEGGKRGSSLFMGEVGVHLHLNLLCRTPIVLERKKKNAF